MDDRIWKWAFLIPVICMAIAIISIALYMLLPLICSTSDICSFLRNIFAFGPFILILLSGLSFMAIILLAIIEVLLSSKFGVLRKLLWIAALLIFPISVVIYYTLDRKNAV